MPIDPITILWAVGGLPETLRAFDTIDQRIQRMERASKTATDEGVRSRVSAAKNETREKERLEKQQTRDKEAEQKRRDALVRKSSEMAGRYADEEVREDARREKEKTRAIEREEERKTALRRRSSEMAGRFAAQQASKEIAEAERVNSVWGRRGRRIGGVISRSVGGLVGGATAMLGAGAGIGGGMLLADSFRREMSAEKAAANLINQVTTGGTAPEGATVGNILAKASPISTETGMSKTEIIQGVQAYSKTAKSGNFKGAMGNMEFFAKLARVSNTDMTEVAGAAGMLESQNPALKDPRQMQKMMLDLYAQTHAGSLSMTEMISQAGTMGSVRAGIQGDESVNQRKLIALGQLVAPASGAESGIMIKDLVLEATKGKHLQAAKAMGVHFDALDHIESPEQMIGAVLKSTGGNIGKMNDVFGSRGSTVLRELAGGYSEAVKSGGKPAGERYVQDTIGAVTSSTMSPEELNKRMAETMDNSAEKFSLATNKIINLLEDKLGPEMDRLADGPLPKLVDKLEYVIDEAVKFAGWMGESWPHTFEGIGGIVGLAIAKSCTDAAIGDGVKKVLEQGLKFWGNGGSPIPDVPAGGGPPVPGGGGVAGAAGAAAKAAGGLASLGFFNMMTDIVSGKDEKDRAAYNERNKNYKPIDWNVDWNEWGQSLKRVVHEAFADPINFLLSKPGEYRPSPAPPPPSGGPAIATNGPAMDPTRRSLPISERPNL